MAKSKQYTSAGVDIDLAGKLLGSVKGSLSKATRPEVLGSVGGFGGLFDLSGFRMREPVLVSSTDGVGTKVKVAFDSGKNEGIGHDIVNHCCNDIAVSGAEPLMFLDYYATGKLDGKVYRSVLRGIAKACQAANCALIGGETAEMPGFYPGGEYDLVGTIVGIVEKKRIVSGAAIRPGDKIVGLASSGLHTNGFSLARRIFFEQLNLKLTDKLPGSRLNLATALLKPHTNYSTLLQELYRKFNQGKRGGQRKGNAITGAAHITGGGFTGNIPRILPKGCGAVIDTSSWSRPPLFKVLEETGGVEFDELFEVFNMGIGLVLTVNGSFADVICQSCRSLGHRASIIGEVIKGDGNVKMLSTI